MEMEVRKILVMTFAGIALASAGCSSLLYYPTRTKYVAVEKLQPPPEERIIHVQAEQAVHGWYFRAHRQPALGLVVYFHGNGQNRSAHFLTLYEVVSQGYDLAIFDYPGYGQSRGQPTPKNTVETAGEILRTLKQEIPPDMPLIVYGQSLGGAIAVRAVCDLQKPVERFRPDLLVIDSSFLSYRQAARGVMARSAWTWALQWLGWLLMSDEYAPGDCLGEIKAPPLVVIHSRGDEVISYELGERVFNSSRGPREFWTKDTGGHNETYEGEQGRALMKRLIERLPRRAPSS